MYYRDLNFESLLLDPLERQAKEALVIGTIRIRIKQVMENRALNASHSVTDLMHLCQERSIVTLIFHLTFSRIFLSFYIFSEYTSSSR